MSLALRVCTDPSEWDAFVDESPQGSVFCASGFLAGLPVRPELILVEDGGQAVLGAPMLLDETGVPFRAPFPFTLYQGVIFSHGIESLPTHRRVDKEMKALNFLLSELEQRYARISFCTHPATHDLRAFQWFHYHQPERGRFSIDLAYTALLDLSSLPGIDGLANAIASGRRSDLRKAVSAGLTAEPTTDLGLLARLYRATFERQQIAVDERTEELVLGIAGNTLSHGFGELLLCRHPGGDVISLTLFLHDRRCGYYLIGANDPQHRSTGGATYLLLESIRRCMERGLSCVDFVGVNSPNRGDFKLGFNASPVPYFAVNWERPGSTP